MLSALLASSALWAQDRSDVGPGVTRAERAQVTPGTLKDQNVALLPMVGALAFTDTTGNSTSRAAYGVQLDWNLSHAIAGADLTSGLQNLYFGPETGVVFSHLGDPTSNFFGSSPSTTAGQGGSNFLFIPTDLKLGYNVNDNLRISAHGGGNVTYRTVANSLFLGDSSAQSGSVWRWFPNVGGDVEMGFGHDVSLLLRPDVTLTPGNTIFAGMIGLGINMG